MNWVGSTSQSERFQSTIKSIKKENKRVIVETLPYLHSVALGIFFNQGSRDEESALSGISHLIEHMLFKGTRRLSAQEISHTIEYMGGTIDGFTSKDSSGIYARFASEHLQRVTQLLSEIVSQPKFGEEELKREKNVVREEIKSSVENPQDLVIDLLFKALYHPHPLSFPIAGKGSIVDTITRDRLIDYYESHYTKENMIIVGVGGIERRSLIEALELDLNRTRVIKRRLKASGVGNKRVETVKKKELSQAYVALALPSFSLKDPRRHTLSILSTGLGGGMSSRLFTRLREDEGLVYSVSSSVGLFEDTGFLCIYFITDKKNLDRVMGIILKELDEIKKKGFTKKEFTTAKNLTIGSTLLGLENPTARMLRIARHIFSYDRIISIEETLRKYREVDEEMMKELIEEIFSPSHLFLSAVGPIEEKDLEKFLR